VNRTEALEIFTIMVSSSVRSRKPFKGRFRVLTQARKYERQELRSMCAALRAMRRVPVLELALADAATALHEQGEALWVSYGGRQGKSRAEYLAPARAVADAIDNDT
jgi:hypothetical protein